MWFDMGLESLSLDLYWCEAASVLIRRPLMVRLGLIVAVARLLLGLAMSRFAVHGRLANLK
jgi:hypothetical protein